MAASQPLTGIELIDCAKANAEQGVTVAAELCGYGQNISRFQQSLEQACRQIGVEISSLSDLITDQQTVIQTGGIEVAPDTPDEL
ncbi:hypothetical protein [Leptolyngbya sp. FACHB-711]|uniref:hypothetical protein n=2 Tax=Leptolyngbya TaxID=47251 RepID=UPI00168413C7|nr:hypothetical protein [Leptolyngbya sp. FACHB-711]MBD1850578.1 hypothetical protein [Cyanobacteria bacterium FACHB-502]MBD2023954.1 hypothetical protein [Leptolyngbya sp. FACHB-711]